MPSYFTYLISSLPMLHFGMKPPFSFKKFLEVCGSFIPESDSAILQNISLMPQNDFNNTQDTLRKWYDFETTLRNELVRFRSARKSIDPSKYLRLDTYSDSRVKWIAHSAQKNPSMLEGEKMLDAKRWHFLDELSLRHYFDMDILIIYGLKLLILEKWHKIVTADAGKELDAVVGVLG